MGRFQGTLAASVTLPGDGATNPPIVLIHGGANSALVWTYWQRELAAVGWSSYAVDLRGHGRSDLTDLSRTSMADYASDVQTVAAQFSQKPVVAGWSMGGLIAMMVAAAGDAAACVALVPSLPARYAADAVALRAGEFGPEEYGITSRDPRDQPAMHDLDREEREIALASLGRESRLARDERKAGIVITSLPCPMLIVASSADSQWPPERYGNLWLDADRIIVEHASHWGLILNRRLLVSLVPATVRWLARALNE